MSLMVARTCATLLLGQLALISVKPTTSMNAMVTCRTGQQQADEGDTSAKAH
jgi:hypothetical protein